MEFLKNMKESSLLNCLSVELLNKGPSCPKTFNARTQEKINKIWNIICPWADLFVKMFYDKELEVVIEDYIFSYYPPPGEMQRRGHMANSKFVIKKKDAKEVSFCFTYDLNRSGRSIVILNEAGWKDLIHKAGIAVCTILLEGKEKIKPTKNKINREAYKELIENHNGC